MMHKNIHSKIAMLILIAFIITVSSACHFRFDIPCNANPIVASHAIEHHIPYGDYPASLIQLLERNPEAAEFVLNYPILSREQLPIDLSEYADSKEIPLFLQWDSRWGYLKYGNDFAAITGCGPICLSMVAFHLTGDAQFSPEKMIAFADNNGYYSPGNGSSWTLISEGGKALGFEVAELPLDEGILFNKLSSGIPVVCVVGPGDFTTSGHFLVMTGIENGMIKINDPNSIIRSNQLWSYDQLKSQIRNLWSMEYFE